jgi:hypothetical protein
MSTTCWSHRLTCINSRTVTNWRCRNLASISRRRASSAASHSWAIMQPVGTVAGVGRHASNLVGGAVGLLGPALRLGSVWGPAAADPGVSMFSVQLSMAQIVIPNWQRKVGAT